MTNIFKAFDDYKKLHQVLPPIKGGRAWTPLFVETFEERKAVMARIRAAYPEVYSPIPEQPTETPMQQLTRISQKFIDAPIAASQALIAQYRIKPSAPVTPNEPAQDS